MYVSVKGRRLLKRKYIIKMYKNNDWKTAVKVAKGLCQQQPNSKDLSLFWKYKTVHKRICKYISKKASDEVKKRYVRNVCIMQMLFDPDFLELQNLLNVHYVCIERAKKENKYQPRIDHSNDFKNNDNKQIKTNINNKNQTKIKINNNNNNNKTNINNDNKNEIKINIDNNNNNTKNNNNQTDSDKNIKPNNNNEIKTIQEDIKMMDSEVASSKLDSSLGSDINFDSEEPILETCFCGDEIFVSCDCPEAHALCYAHKEDNHPECEDDTKQKEINKGGGSEKAKIKKVVACKDHKWVKKEIGGDNTKPDVITNVGIQTDNKLADTHHKINNNNKDNGVKTIVSKVSGCVYYTHTKHKADDQVQQDVTKGHNQQTNKTNKGCEQHKDNRKNKHNSHKSASEPGSGGQKVSEQYKSYDKPKDEVKNVGNDDSKEEEDLTPLTNFQQDMNDAKYGDVKADYQPKLYTREEYYREGLKVGPNKHMRYCLNRREYCNFNNGFGYFPQITQGSVLYTHFTYNSKNKAFYFTRMPALFHESIDMLEDDRFVEVSTFRISQYEKRDAKVDMAFWEEGQGVHMADIYSYGLHDEVRADLKVKLVVLMKSRGAKLTTEDMWSRFTNYWDGRRYNKSWIQYFHECGALESLIDEIIEEASDDTSVTAKYIKYSLITRDSSLPRLIEDLYRDINDSRSTVQTRTHYLLKLIYGLENKIIKKFGDKWFDKLISKYDLHKTSIDFSVFDKLYKKFHIDRSMMLRAVGGLGVFGMINNKKVAAILATFIMLVDDKSIDDVDELLSELFLDSGQTFGSYFTRLYNWIIPPKPHIDDTTDNMNQSPFTNQVQNDNEFAPDLEEEFNTGYFGFLPTIDSIRKRLHNIKNMITGKVSSASTTIKSNIPSPTNFMASTVAAIITLPISGFTKPFFKKYVYNQVETKINNIKSDLNNRVTYMRNKLYDYGIYYRDNNKTYAVRKQVLQVKDNILNWWHKDVMAWVKLDFIGYGMVSIPPDIVREYDETIMQNPTNKIHDRKLLGVEFYKRPKIYNFIPGMTTPIKYAMNTGDNAYVAIKYRQGRYLGECQLSAVKELRECASNLVKQIDFKVTDGELLSEEEWVQSRKWPKSKKDNYLLCTKLVPDKLTYKCFIKTEPEDKPLFKIPRLISAPETIVKRTYGPVHHMLMKKAKEFFKVHKRNTTRKVYTSGMNRDFIGIEFTKVWTIYEVGGFIMLIWSLDYEKFDSTQVAFVLNTLRVWYGNLTEGECRKKILEYLRMVASECNLTWFDNDNEDDGYVIAKQIAKRKSGDIDTTDGTTFLSMSLSDYILDSDIKHSMKELIWSFNAGDDCCLMTPIECKDQVDLDKVQKLGLKLKGTTATNPVMIDYNSSFFIRVFDRTIGEERFHLQAKPGRLLSRVGKFLEGNKFFQSKITIQKYAAQKCMAVYTELKAILPGVAGRYKELSNKYYKGRSNISAGFEESYVLKTTHDVEPCDTTLEDLAYRYGLDKTMLQQFDEDFPMLDPNTNSLEEYETIPHVKQVLGAFYRVDLNGFTLEDVAEYRKYGYDDDYLDIFTENYITDEYEYKEEEINSFDLP
jgi:hypothetical protein